MYTIIDNLDANFDVSDNVFWVINPHHDIRDAYKPKPETGVSQNR